MHCSHHCKVQLSALNLIFSGYPYLPSPIPEKTILWMTLDRLCGDIERSNFASLVLMIRREASFTRSEMTWKRSSLYHLYTFYRYTIQTNASPKITAFQALSVRSTSHLLVRHCFVFLDSQRGQTLIGQRARHLFYMFFVHLFSSAGSPGSLRIDQRVSD